MRHERLGRAAMSVLLSVAMAAGGVPAAPPAALAEEPATATITPGEGGTGTGEMAVTLSIPRKTPTAAHFAYTAPADLAYSGEAKSATVVAATDVVGMGDITVGYYSDEARTTAVDPVNVGTYYVGATVEAGDNYEASANVLYGNGWTFAITKSTPDAPAVPSVESKDKNSVTLRGEDGCEYSRDGIAWQESPTFAGLLPSTEYSFYQRYKETANTNASAASGKLLVTTDPDTYARLTVSATGWSGKYDGKPHGITVTVRPAAANASVWYSTRRLTAANYTVAGSRAPVTRTDPGTTTVYYYVVAPNHEAVAGSKDVTVNSSVIGLTGTGHVQRDGDAAAKPSGKGIVIGTTGQSKRLEQFSVALPAGTDGSIEYRGHLQGIGWDGWVQGGKPCGTTGESRRMEAVQMRLTGALAETHSVWYRVHSQTWGTLGWARDGQAAGTAGQSKRAEAIEVQVLPKGQVPEGYVEREASYVGAVSANVHLQGTGWTGASSALEFGTTGQSRRLEAMRISAPATPVSAGISYEVHAQSRGWMPAAADGALAGTTGQAKRLEAVRISLTGDAAKDGGYSVWYRVHSQSYGWLGWAHDGQEAGTTGLAKRAEAIDVQVLPQGQVPRGYDASKAACVNG